MNRAHVLLFWASTIVFAISTAIAADWVDSSYLAAWALAGVTLFVAAHAIRET